MKLYSGDHLGFWKVMLIISFFLFTCGNYIPHYLLFDISTLLKKIVIYCAIKVMGNILGFFCVFCDK